MRYRLALIATLIGAPALAQDNPAAREQVAARIAAAAQALSQYKSLDNGLWAGVSGSSIDDRRPGQSRKVTVRALQFGYDHRFESVFDRFDQLLLGFAGGVLDSYSHAPSQNLQIKSDGWSATAYGAYAPFPFLSFPVSLSYTKWTSDQTRDGTPLLPVYSTSYKSHSWASSAGAALTVPVSRYLLTSGLTHRYADNHRPAYSEAINPLATDFQNTNGEVTTSSQLVANFRLTLPLENARLWASAGYARDLHRAPVEETRSEVPLGVGVDLFTLRWTVGAAGQVTLREDITAYTGSLVARLQF